MNLHRVSVCLTKSSVVLTTLLALFNLHDVVNVMDQRDVCDPTHEIQEIQIATDYIMTEGESVMIALRQNCE